MLNGCPVPPMANNVVVSMTIETSVCEKASSEAAATAKRPTTNARTKRRTSHHPHSNHWRSLTRPVSHPRPAAHEHPATSRGGTQPNQQNYRQYDSVGAHEAVLAI